MNNEDFLSNDLPKANAVYASADILIKRLKMVFLKGDFQEMKHTAVILLNTIDEIEHLKTRKEYSVRLNNVIAKYQRQGINITKVVRRHVNQSR